MSKASRNDTVLTMLAEAADVGITVRELRGHTGWHHGAASAVLSHLHRKGAVARLELMRHRCGIYLLPQYTLGRDTVPFHRHLTTQPDPLVDALAERDKLWEAYHAGAVAFQRIDTATVAEAFDRWLDDAVSEVDVLGDNVVSLADRRR